jgi:prepilin-type N-terminal cleavage/methylation domain-containing protein
MVLKPAGPARGQRGLSLLELLIAVSLAGMVVGMALALYKDVFKTAGFAGQRLQGEEKAQSAFTSLVRNLRYGAGMVRLSENSLELLNISGRKLEYRWEDSVLSVDGNPRSFRLASLKVEAMGPSIPLGSDGYPDWNLAPALDSLDEDRDGAIDFDELDRDGDGELDLEECRFVSHVRLTMVSAVSDPPSTRTALIYPRNHARDSVSLETDTTTQSE